MGTEYDLEEMGEEMLNRAAHMDDVDEVAASNYRSAVHIAEAIRQSKGEGTPEIVLKGQESSTVVLDLEHYDRLREMADKWRAVKSERLEAEGFKVVGPKGASYAQPQPTEAPERPGDVEIQGVLFGLSELGSVLHLDFYNGDECFRFSVDSMEQIRDHLTACIAYAKSREE